MAHICHARGCEKSCPPKHLMCKAHWFKVPKALRDAVWSAYVPGQEVSKDPTSEWHEAADAAIASVGVVAPDRQTGLF